MGLLQGVSTVVPSTTALPTTTAPSPTIVAPAVTSATSSTNTPATSASSSVTGTEVSAASAEQASGSAVGAAFTLPGKKLSVLPIGLGVFAGISVIALIVVGLVTYERTKYRKASL